MSSDSFASLSANIPLSVLGKAHVSHVLVIRDLALFAVEGDCAGELEGLDVFFKEERVAAAL